MRILLFLHSFGPGGVERVALRLAGAWADAGADVKVLIGRCDGPDRAIAPENVIYEFAPPHPMARPFETLWMVRHLVSAVRRHRPDVLFCAGNTYTVVCALARLILGSECPPIACKLSNSLDRSDLPPPARWAHQFWLGLHRHFIDLFVGLSEPMRAEIARSIRVPPGRIAVIPNPVLSSDDLQRLSEPPSSTQRIGRRFVAVGRLSRQKNHRLLLRAFARIAGADDRLQLVGDGAERARLARLAARLGIAAQIEMSGHLPSVSEALKGADVFVSSSNYEGLPGAIVEALAAGLPIVSTESSGCVAHVLASGELGRLVPVGNVEALARAMFAAPRREDLPLAAMQSAAAEFTVERSAGFYLDALAVAAAAPLRAAASPRETAEPKAVLRKSPVPLA